MDQLSPVPAAIAGLELLKPWQRSYLVALQATRGDREKARMVPRISPSTVEAEIATNLTFARAHDAIIAGVVLFPHVRETRAAPAILEAFTTEALSEVNTLRDRNAVGRTVLEAEGVLGSGAQAGVHVALPSDATMELYLRVTSGQQPVPSPAAVTAMEAKYRQKPTAAE